MYFEIDVRRELHTIEKEKFPHPTKRDMRCYVHIVYTFFLNDARRAVHTTSTKKRKPSQPSPENGVCDVITCIVYILKVSNPGEH
jgi:hypothetical protein